MYKEQNECGHDKLTFGSGDFYIFCTDCGRSWVHRSVDNDQPSYDHSPMDFSSAYRVKFPDNLTFMELKARDKGLDCDGREEIQS